MYLRHLFSLLLLLTKTGQFWCNAILDVPKDAHLSVHDDLPYLQYGNRSNVYGNGVELDMSLTSSLKSAPISAASPVLPKQASPVLPKQASVSANSEMLTKSKTTSSASPASSPGRKDVSRTVNILFTILLGVTAILLVITGLCMTGLRRRYLDLSMPKYDSLGARQCSHHKQDKSFLI